MLATPENITQFIPQRSPMVMIGNLVQADDVQAITQLRISSDNIFSDSGNFTEPGLVENIAQTAAAHVGYQCQLKQIPVPLGYIAAVRNLKVTSLPKVGQVITTTIRIVNQVMDVTVAHGSVECEGQLCCSCEMRIFVKTNNSAL